MSDPNSSIPLGGGLNSSGTAPGAPGQPSAALFNFDPSVLGLTQPLSAANLMKPPTMSPSLNLASSSPMPFAAFSPAMAKGMGTPDLQLGLPNPSGPFNPWSIAASIPTSTNAPRAGTVSISSAPPANLSGLPGPFSTPVSDSAATAAVNNDDDDDDDDDEQSATRVKRTATGKMKRSTGPVTETPDITLAASAAALASSSSSAPGPKITVTTPAGASGDDDDEDDEEDEESDTPGAADALTAFATHATNGALVPMNFAMVPAGQHGAQDGGDDAGQAQFIDITHYLNMPQSQAAKKLGIPTSTLSKRWKEAVRNRKWPYRAISKLDKEIMTLLHNIPQNGDNAPLPADIEATLGHLLRRRQEELKPVRIRIN